MHQFAQSRNTFYLTVPQACAEILRHTQQHASALEYLRLANTYLAIQPSVRDGTCALCSLDPTKDQMDT